MKIALVCSRGGHLTEMLHLLDAFKDHEVFFITYDSPRTQDLSYRKYLIRHIGGNPLKMIRNIPRFLWILKKEEPQLIVSTGSEIAIPVFYCAKVLGIKTIFIESWCRIYGLSGTGKLVYPVANIFLVQWESLLKKYWKKAQYRGALI